MGVVSCPFKKAPSFLASQDVLGSCIFSLPQVWNQLSLQGALIALIGEWCLDTKIWVLSEERPRICMH